MKKNTTAEKAILDANKAAKAIKENTENTLQEMMNNAIAKLVMESEDKPEDEKDDYEVEDVKTEDEPKSDDVASVAEPELSADDSEKDEPAADDVDADKSGEDPADDSADGANDEWSELDDFKVDGDKFDFTGLEGEELLKIFRQLQQGDKLLIAKNDDGSISVENSKEDAADVSEPDSVSDDEPADNDASSEDADDFSIDDEFSADDISSADDASDNADISDDDFSIEDDTTSPDGDSAEEETHIDINEENLGYTDSYQKDVFDKKFNMKEPGDSKTTYSMDGGAPESAEKPWVGKHTEPDYKKVEECGDVPVDADDANIEEDGSGLNTKHKMVKTQNHINKDAQGQKVVSQNGEYKGNLNESVKKIIAKAKEIQKINEEYGKAIDKLKKSLMESAVSNVSLVNMVKLLSECTMTIDEKKNLMERFKNVKTLKESKETYETIKKELNESAAKSAPIIEKQIKAEPNSSINETVLYKNNPAISLMDRMDNLYKN